MCLIKGVDYDYFANANLMDYCTFKIGGKAKHLVVAKNIKTLIKVCYICKIHNIRYKVIGFGANLLFDDLGFNGVIIVNRCQKILFNKNCIYVGSGLSVGGLISKCISRGLTGIENLAGIPSSVGGAVVNNLGAFETSFGNFVEHCTCLDLNNFKLVKLNNNECKFSYRDSVFKHSNFVVLKVKLKLNFLASEKVRANFLSALRKKVGTQPINEPSAGSVFKRTIDADSRPFIPAKIIDDLGLKGLTVGGACVSTKHAGFIVNKGGASSCDVLTLIEMIKNKVRLAYGINLPLEIEIVEANEKIYTI